MHCSRVSLLSWDKTCACTVPGRIDLLQQDSPFLPGESGHSWMLGFTPGKKKTQSTHITQMQRPDVKLSIAKPSGVNTIRAVT